MPKKGYKSITVKSEVYDFYHAKWQKRKKEYALKGITSFSAFVSYTLGKELKDS